MMAGERIERAAYSVRDLNRAAYSTRDLIKLYGIGKTRLFEEIAAGRLIAHRLGGKNIYLAPDVERWIGSLPRVWPRDDAA